MLLIYISRDLILIVLYSFSLYILVSYLNDAPNIYDSGVQTKQTHHSTFEKQFKQLITEVTNVYHLCSIH